MTLLTAYDPATYDPSTNDPGSYDPSTNDSGSYDPGSYDGYDAPGAEPERKFQSPEDRAGAASVYWSSRTAVAERTRAQSTANWFGTEHLSTKWMQLGNCANKKETATFFPSDGAGVKVAQELCEGCPVKAECLNYAIEHHINHGVWGGASERQRRRVHSQRRAQRRAAALQQTHVLAAG